MKDSKEVLVTWSSESLVMTSGKFETKGVYRERYGKWDINIGERGDNTGSGWDSGKDNKSVRDVKKER